MVYDLSDETVAAVIDIYSPKDVVIWFGAWLRADGNQRNRMQGRIKMQADVTDPYVLVRDVYYSADD